MVKIKALEVYDVDSQSADCIGDINRQEKT